MKKMSQNIDEKLELKCSDLQSKFDVLKFVLAYIFQDIYTNRYHYDKASSSRLFKEPIAVHSIAPYFHLIYLSFLQPRKLHMERTHLRTLELLLSPTQKFPSCKRHLHTLYSQLRLVKSLANWNLDSLFLWMFSGFGHSHFQHSIFQLCLHLIQFDIIWKNDSQVITAMRSSCPFISFFLLCLVLSLDDKGTIFHHHLHLYHKSASCLKKSHTI